jgi:hypothetical protein
MVDSDRRPQLSYSLTYFMVSVRKISDLILEVQSYLIPRHESGEEYVVPRIFLHDLSSFRG